MSLGYDNQPGWADESTLSPERGGKLPESDEAHHNKSIHDHFQATAAEGHNPDVPLSDTAAAVEGEGHARKIDAGGSPRQFYHPDILGKRPDRHDVLLPHPPKVTPPPAGKEPEKGGVTKALEWIDHQMVSMPHSQVVVAIAVVAVTYMMLRG